MDRRAAILALAAAASGCRPSGNKELTPEQLGKLLEHRENIFFLDVREPAEISQLGSIHGYVNIPIAQLERRLGEIPRDKVIVTA